MFKSIANIEQIESLIRNYYVKNTITNNYLMFDSYSDYVRKGSLFYKETNSNLILLLEKDGFFRLYYYINNFDELFFTSAIEFPLVMEILYRNEVNKPLEIMSYWEKNGFKEHLTRNNMMLKYEKRKLPLNINPEINIRIAEKEEEYLYTKELLDISLDKFTGDRLSLEEIVQFGINRNLICSFYEEKICGVLQFEEKNNNVWLGHIAVDYKYRGMGIAKSLVKNFIEMNATTNNCNYQLWVINNNTAAVKLYEDFGFINTGKYTVSMLFM